MASLLVGAMVILTALLALFAFGLSLYFLKFAFYDVWFGAVTIFEKVMGFFFLLLLSSLLLGCGACAGLLFMEVWEAVPLQFMG